MSANARAETGVTRGGRIRRRRFRRGDGDGPRGDRRGVRLEARALIRVAMDERAAAARREAAQKRGGSKRERASFFATKGEFVGAATVAHLRGGDGEDDARGFFQTRRDRRARAQDGEDAAGRRWGRQSWGLKKPPRGPERGHTRGHTRGDTDGRRGRSRGWMSGSDGTRGTRGDRRRDAHVGEGVRGRARTGAVPMDAWTTKMPTRGVDFAAGVPRASSSSPRCGSSSAPRGSEPSDADVQRYQHVLHQQMTHRARDPPPPGGGAEPGNPAAGIAQAQARRGESRLPAATAQGSRRPTSGEMVGDPRVTSPAEWKHDYREPQRQDMGRIHLQQQMHLQQEQRK